jgi:opacity protein-like surface antigen
MPNSWIKIISGLCIASFVMPAAADMDWPEMRPIAVLSGGIAINSDAGESDSFKLGSSTYRYDTEHNTETRGLFGGLLGVDMQVKRHLFWQTGVSYYQATPFEAKGHVTQGVNAQSNSSFPYTYEILTRQLLWENKLAWQWKKRYFPYVLVGIGAAFNSTRDFKVHPVGTATPHYDEQHNNSFTYSLGAGIDYALHKHVRLGLGYRFADLGKAGLGDGTLTTPFASASAPDFASQSHLYTQEILAQLTFLM